MKFLFKAWFKFGASYAWAHAVILEKLRYQIFVDFLSHGNDLLNVC